MILEDFSQMLCELFGIAFFHGSTDCLLRVLGITEDSTRSLDMKFIYFCGIWCLFNIRLLIKDSWGVINSVGILGTFYWI